jgi:hypothetical protein
MRRVVRGFHRRFWSRGTALPPHRWDELAHHDTDTLQPITGQPIRPSLAAEPVAWEALQLTSRWLDDGTRAVAALQPSLVASWGADAWHRFQAEAQARGELALAISMIGSPEPPKIVIFLTLVEASQCQAARMALTWLEAGGLPSPRSRPPQKA